MRGAPVPALVAALTVALPACVGVAYVMLASLRMRGPGATGFDTVALHIVLTSTVTWQSIAWTLATAGAATALSLVAAAVIAMRVRESRVWRLVALAPLAVPHIAAALAAVLLLGQAGLLSRLAHSLGLIQQPADFPALVYDRQGVALVLAFAWKEIPYLTLTALAVLASSGSDLDDAARTLGATAHEVRRRVTWPLLWRGMGPGALAVFAFLVGQYEMPSLLAPSNPLPLSLLTYERYLHPDLSQRAQAHVLSLIALVLALGAVAGHVWFMRRRDIS